MNRWLMKDLLYQEKELEGGGFLFKIVGFW